MILEVHITDMLCEAAMFPVETVKSVVSLCPQLLHGRWQVQSDGPLQHLFTHLQVSKPSERKASLVSALLLNRQKNHIPEAALCLLPVQLNLQRDSYSLQTIVPLTKSSYQQLTTHINAHFSADFNLHMDPGCRYWWVQPLKTLEVESPWPQSVLFQQAFAWQPTGKDARVVRQWTNEGQMLLHQLTNHEDAFVQDTLNSLWFCNIPPLPTWQIPFDLVTGQGRLFEGLLAANFPNIKPLDSADFFKNRHARHALFVADQVQDVAWEHLSAALKQGLLKQLKIIIPFAERSVLITLDHRQRWCFWRKPLVMDALLEQLQQTLQSPSNVR